MPLFPIPPAAIGTSQRVLLVALLMPALLLIVLATVPALMMLPFLRDGIRRTSSLMRAHTEITATLLKDSRTR
jgi:hypothetical protein